MDIISFNEASTANGRIENFIENPDSSSGVVTVPKVIASGETITIPAGRVAILPDLQVDGDLIVDGDLFIPTGSMTSQVVQKVTSTDNAVVRFNGTTGDVQNSGVVIDDSGNIASGSITSTNSGLVSYFGIYDNNTTQINSYSGTTGKDIVFRQYNTERMRITSNGELLVGTQNGSGIAGNVSVNGNISCGGGLLTNLYYNNGWKYLGNGYGWANYTDGNSGKLFWESAGNNTSGNGASATPVSRMCLDNSGNLGIGVSSTTAALDVLQKSSDSSNALTLRGYTTGTDGTRTVNMNAITSDANNWAVLNSKAASFTWSLKGSGVAMALGGGTLNIYSNIPEGASMFQATNQFDNGYTTIAAAGTGTYWGSAHDQVLEFVPASGGNGAISAYSGSLKFLTSGRNERMRIDSAGNVGIGTSNAIGKLTIKQSDEFRGINIVSAYNTNEWGITCDGSNSLRFSYNGNGLNSGEKMRIDSSGNVGIGFTPYGWLNSKSLDISGYASFSSEGNYAANVSNNAYSTADGVWKYKTAGYQSAMYRQGAGVHEWKTAPNGTAGNTISWTNAMTLASSGNLLVGTTTDNGVDKLQVNGSISSGAINILTYGDLNNYRTVTQTIGTFPAMSNIPIGDHGYLEVVVYNPNNWVLQRFTALGASNTAYAGRTFVRCYVNATTWTPWVEK